MKRIVNIDIENVKAYIQHQHISLENGENLLIYGENGSGKTSLYKAVKSFMKSSVDHSVTLVTNRYSQVQDGHISITFADYDVATNSIDDATKITFTQTQASETTDTDNPDLKACYRVSGFLDYAKLLKVYLHDSQRPNLFNLLMELLHDFIPVTQGLDYEFGEKFKTIGRCMRLCRHRNDRQYLFYRSTFNAMSVAFPNIIADLNVRLSYLIDHYFRHLNFEVKLVNPAMTIDERGRIRDLKVGGTAFLEVMHCGLEMNDYNFVLNEARLSAISICLYLASLQLHSTIVNSKILYLDDVFIGLDSSNRRPVIEMLLHEFIDYQIFISTYDKSWFMLAKEIIGEDSPRWKYFELYEGTYQIGDRIIPKPILIKGKSDLEKAKRFLLDTEHLDYPASANYLRKAFECLLTKKPVRLALIKDDLEPIAAYKLNKVILSLIRFYNRFDFDQDAAAIKSTLSELLTLLRPLLHPLSHYAPDSPVFKSELIAAIKIYESLESMFVTSGINSRIKIVLEKGSKLSCVFKGDSGWSLIYYFSLADNLFLYRNGDGNERLLDAPVFAERIEEFDNMGLKIHSLEISNNSKLRKNLSFDSLEQCYNNLSLYIMDPDKENKTDIIIPANKFDDFYIPTEGNAPLVFNVKLSSKIR